MSRRPLGREVFLDTNGLVAIVDASDALHGAATRIEQELASSGSSVVLSDAVISEFLAYMAGPRALRAAAVAAVDALMASPEVTILPATRRAMLAAFGLYRSRPDKEWSLVDCSSMLICQERAIRRVFTHDRHFRQAGFEILLP